MRPLSCFVLVSCAFSAVALAQQPTAAPATPAPRTETSQRPPSAGEKTVGGLEVPPPDQSLEARVGQVVDDFEHRHDERVLAMSAYGKAGETDPSLKQFAEPRKVEIELKDEQDREQTSQALAKLYTEEARHVQTQEQALRDFIAKRQKTLDGLSKQANIGNRKDLELAAENLAHQPGNEAQVAEIRRELDKDARDAEEMSTEQSLAQQEATSAQEELKRLEALEHSLEKEAKTFMADAASAQQNQLHLADRLEFYLIDAQSDDVLDQGRKAEGAVHHLAASPEVQDTLGSLNPDVKPGTKSSPADPCTDAANDAKGCTEKAPSAPKE